MKTAKYIIFLLLCVFSAQAQNQPFNINGKIKELSSGKIYLSVFERTAEQDSTIIEDGEFQARGKLKEVSLVILSLGRKYVNQPLFIFFDKRNHTVRLNKDTLEEGTVIGPEMTMDFVQFKNVERRSDDKFTALLGKNKENISNNQIIKDKIFAEQYKALEDFIGSGRSSYCQKSAEKRYRGDFKNIN